MMHCIAVMLELTIQVNSLALGTLFKGVTVKFAHAREQAYCVFNCLTL